MAVINTNVKALFSQMALGSSGRAQSVAMQQLSTGKRINSARDDAAGMAIATRMTHQIRSLTQAVRNSGDAINLIQTAEGATNEINDMLIRMRELAIQSVNDTNANEQRSYLDLEFQQLKQEIVRISETTEWNGFPVLTGAAGERVGEMPVYKATSSSEFAPVLINPETERTVGGTGAGEVQEVQLTGFTPLTGTNTGVMNVGGVTVQVTSDETTVQKLADKIKTTLSNSLSFDTASGRSVAIKSGTTDTLVFTYAASDGNVDSTYVRAERVTVGATITDDVKPALNNASEKFDTNGAFLKSGALTMDLNSPSAGAVTAKFVTSDNQTITLTGTLTAATGEVKFEKTAGDNRSVIAADVTYVINKANGTAGNLTGRDVSLTVNVMGGVPPLKTGDLLINGVDVGPTYAIDDPFSPVNNASGSAIAIAAAINRKAVDSGVTTGEQQTLTLVGSPQPGTVVVGGVSVTLTSLDNTPVLAAAKIAQALKDSGLYNETDGRKITYAVGSTTIGVSYDPKEGDVADIKFEKGQTGLTGIVETTVEHFTAVQGTGVFAKVNENVLTGVAMKSSAVTSGVVFINGYASADITTVLNNPRESRAAVVRAINMISDKTGVKAIDTNSDTQGVTLVAADGRNIEVRFETSANASVFGSAIGMRQGVQRGTYALESKIPTPVVLSSASTGSIARAGMVEGNFSRNESVFNTSERATVQPSLEQIERVTVSATGTVALNDTFTVMVNGSAITYTAAAGDKPMKIRDELVAAINIASAANNLGVTASAGNALGELLLTANVPGESFISSVKDASTNGALVHDAMPVQANQGAQIKPLSQNDLVINGVKIRATTNADDLLSDTTSTSSDASSSAIALANAINSHSVETGVRAQANPVISKGVFTVTKPDPEAGSYSLYLNGTEVSVYLDPADTEAVRRDKVVAAINERTGQHGITATNNGKGVTIESDGRNVSAWFDSNVQGLSAASFGLDKGDAVAQSSTIKLSNTAVGDTATIVLNGEEITATATTTSDLPAKMLAAIQAKIDDGTLKNISLDTSGTDIVITSSIAGSPFTLTGAKASDPTKVTLTLNPVVLNSVGTNDITGIFNATEKSTTATTLYGTVRMISDAALLPKLPSPIGAPPSDQLAKLHASGKPFTVSVGDDGFADASNFAALGFQVGTYGGQSSAAMDPPRVGRMAFQVGAGAQQLITIDLADFGKGGPITSEITGDVDLNVDQRAARINTREGASSVLAKLDAVMERVNATRATMGAVMNRLDHVINNLTNVSMNLSASRSSIEDADYAQASTELAKTQIMQQAATAVLAQANTSQQSVLKLLGG